MSNSMKLFVIFAAGMVMVIVGAAVVFGLIRYQRFQATTDDLPPESIITQAGISNLSNGAEAQLGHPLHIEGYAAGPNAFLSLELWIDGQLVSVQSAYSLGSSPFNTSFTWLPDTPGAHSLVLRAIDETQQTTNSNPVIVLVPEQEAGATNDVAAFSGDGGEDVPTVFPAGASSYSIPAPSGDDSVGDASDWSSSVGDWVNNFANADLPPIAPELAATAGQCAANLSFHDLSDNELGFKVQRYLPPFDQWVEVATLDAQSQDDWLSYTDAGISGAVQYQVVAYNQAGKAASNVVPVNVDPSNCPDIQAELPVVNLSLQSLDLPSSTDMAYCYRSFDGGIDWERWPASDFFYPEDDGNFDVLVQSSWQFNVIGQPAAQTFDLLLECWGWSGAGLNLLGTYEYADIDPLVAGLHPSSSGDSAITLGVWPGNQLEQIEFYPLNDYEAQIQYQEDIPDSLTSVLSAFAPEEREMPGIILRVTDDADLCEAHLSPESRNLVGRILFCFPYPGFDAEESGGDAGVNPQQYLIWDFDLNGCRLAIYDPSACKSYEYYLEQAELTEGQVGFWINDSASQNQHAQNAAGFTQFVIPPLSCGSQQRTFSVQMWYKPGPKSLDPEVIQAGQVGPGNVFAPLGEGEQIITAGVGPEEYVLSKLYFVGPLSNEVTIPCPEPLGDTITLDIRFTTMELSNLSDGEDVTDVELYGFLLARTNAGYKQKEHFLNLATWQEQDNVCPDDPGYSPEYEPNEQYRNFGCPQKFYPGTYSFTEPWVYACDSSHRENCIVDPHDDNFFEFSNNGLLVQIPDGASLDLIIELWDWDDDSGDDLICVGQAHLDARSLFEWTEVDDSGAIFGPPQGTGSCVISYTVQAVP